jgi:hypothetical protein
VFLDDLLGGLDGLLAHGASLSTIQPRSPVFW